MKFTPGTYESIAAINLAPFKNVKVMLNQINSETNKYNGVPSTVLDAVGVETCNFGGIVTVLQAIPSFKLLRCGLISELKAAIMDEYGKSINNNGQPITAVPLIIIHECLRGGYNYCHRF